MSLDLLNVKETAKRLRVSPRKIASLTAENDLSYVRVGKRVFFREADLEEFLTRNHVPATNGKAKR